MECGSLNYILLLKRSFRPYLLFVSPPFQISWSFAFVGVSETANVVLSCDNAWKLKGTYLQATMSRVLT